MDASKERTRRESSPIKVWVKPAEKAAIEAKADAHSLSAYLHIYASGFQKLPSPPMTALLENGKLPMTKSC
jgi:hypothetical protein